MRDQLYLILALTLWALLTGFMIWLLMYCLRVGRVGPGWAWWRPDAERSKQPFQFWSGIAGLAVGSAGGICIFVYAVWKVSH